MLVAPGTQTSQLLCEAKGVILLFILIVVVIVVIVVIVAVFIVLNFIISLSHFIVILRLHLHLIITLCAPVLCYAIISNFDSIFSLYLAVSAFIFKAQLVALLTPGLGWPSFFLELLGFCVLRNRILCLPERCSGLRNTRRSGHAASLRSGLLTGAQTSNCRENTLHRAT